MVPRVVAVYVTGDGRLKEIRMFELPMTDFMRRVLLTRERVKFHQADPYGHLNAGQYVSLVMGHRVEALHDQLQCNLAYWTKTLKVGFFLRDLSIEYLAPAFVGDFLEVASWGHLLEADGFRARFVIAGERDRSLRAAGDMRFMTVNPETGRKVPLPETLPSEADTNLLHTRPTAEEYLRTMRNLPAGWTPP
jgi:acyl-CoA thioesterase FadM